jgi:hypothetical protein
MTGTGFSGLKRVGLGGQCLLAALLLFVPLSGVLAGELVNAKGPAGNPVSARGDYSLLFAPPQPPGFLDSLTVSPVGEIRSPGRGKSAVSNPSPYHSAGMNLLDQNFSSDRSRSYLLTVENSGRDNPYVGLARIDRGDASQTNRMRFDDYRAELMVGYSLVGGSILFGKGMQMERPGDSSFRLLDDGWRLKFIKKF